MTDAYARLPDLPTCQTRNYDFLPVRVAIPTLVFKGFFARHAFEQYLTSSQFLAQLLRQVMSRPQATQGLLGSDALLPLKPMRCLG